MLCMKMRKYKSKQIGEVDSQLLNIEEMVQTIQWETETMKVVGALQEGNKALDAIHSVMSVEKVETLMDETQEAIAYQEELSGLFAGEELGVDEVGDSRARLINALPCCVSVAKSRHPPFGPPSPSNFHHTGGSGSRAGPDGE